jgi:hypothetical protein
MRASASGNIEAVQHAARCAVEVQDAVNLIAIINAWLQHSKALRDAGANGDLLNNHPVTLAFVSKLNSLCRLNSDREFKAHELCSRLANGETTEYDVIPL